MGDVIVWVILGFFAIVALGAAAEGASVLVAAIRDATERRSSQDIWFLLGAAVAVVVAVALTVWLQTSDSLNGDGTTGVSTFGDSTLGNVAEWLVLPPVIALTLFMTAGVVVVLINVPVSIARDGYRRHVERIEARGYERARRERGPALEPEDE